MTKRFVCIECRATFEEHDILGHDVCPNCGSDGVPADLGLTHTLTFTDKEWKTLFFWAEGFAQSVGFARPLRTLAGIRFEARRQQPTMPNLSLREDAQDLATALNTPVALVQESGEAIIITPLTKH